MSSETISFETGSYAVEVLSPPLTKLAEVSRKGAISAVSSAYVWFDSPKSGVLNGEGRTMSDATPECCVESPPGRKKSAVVTFNAPRPGGSGTKVCTVPLPNVWSSPTRTAR